MIIALSSITVIILIVIGVLFYNGEKDPEIIIQDDRIQINGMYGVDIDVAEVTGISLIQQSMNDIGIGRRTNGYNGFGKALKGNFKSDTLGDILLFVNTDSAPTIKIGRNGKKDVYISFRKSENT